eukprot:CAMPEP_0174836522 /NCGR_PEP_ID=MMETSP1114-20130205/6133_1 /TAXON_ID=312471 /ORGANISM="Neobodo designis, Strain CCAP 1951/1" /LENGTH=346 /DNA_ID=CAMNT_0016070523 /DNA_START=35 /DNA_END=1072 /DNA_ORIENTATION=+
MSDTPYSCSQVPNRCSASQTCCSLYDSWVERGGEGSPDQRYLTTQPWCCEDELRCSPFTPNACLAATPQPLPPSDGDDGAPAWAIYVVICLTLLVLLSIVVAMILIARRRARLRREEKERQAAETLSRFRLDEDGHLVRVDAGTPPPRAADGAADDRSGERSPSVRSDSTDIQAAMSAVRGRLQEHNERLPVPRHGANVREAAPGKSRKESPQAPDDDSAQAPSLAPVKSILKKGEPAASLEAPAKRASFRFSSRIVGATDSTTDMPTDGHTKAAIAASCVQAMTTAALPADKEVGTFASVDTSRVGYAFAAAHRYESGDLSVVALAGDAKPAASRPGTAGRAEVP